MKALKALGRELAGPRTCSGELGTFIAGEKACVQLVSPSIKCRRGAVFGLREIGQDLAAGFRTEKPSVTGQL